MVLEMVKYNSLGRVYDKKFLPFQRMITDIGIAKSCSMQKKKNAYTINFDLAPLIFSRLI